MGQMRTAALKTSLVVLAGVLLTAALVWQAVAAGGNPDPTAHGISPTAGIMDTAVLVYREGLECIMVLAAIVAGLVRTQTVYWKPIATGAAVGFAATLATWFIFVGILSLVADTTSEQNVQAATGLLAIVVLLVVMNWFFHKIYWTGWISLHNRKKNALVAAIASAGDAERQAVRSVAYRGLILLGLASVYREGFEVDIFLQSIRLQVGTANVALGAAFALVLIAITGYFVFVAHQKLPYKKMLVFTGLMLGFVFEIMVGEQINEMQLAHWIPTHAFPLDIPAWAGTWFSVYNNWETVIAQAAAAIFVIGSFYAARAIKPRGRRTSTAPASLT